MAYNPNTRLLLKFNNGDGSTATDDTSSYARSATITGGEVSSAAGVFSTNSVVLGDPFGSGSVGDVTVNDVSTLFSTSSNSLKRVDLWFRPEAYPPWGNSPLFSIVFQNGDTLIAWFSGSSLDVEYNGTATDPAHYLYQSVNFYPEPSQWYHFRFAINGDTLKIALDGSETHSITHTADVWTGVFGNPITAFRIGAWPSAFGVDANLFFRGYIDAVEFLDGDTSWFGGSYTVPSAEPDDYSGSGPVDIFGTGLNALEDFAVFGSSDIPEVSGYSVVSLDDFVGDGLANGLDIVTGDCISQLENVTCSCFGGGQDLNTRLMLHFDNSTGRLTDSSVYNRTISLYGGNVSPNYTGLFQSEALGLESTPYGTSIGCSANGMFDSTTSQKSFEFFYYNNASDTNYRYICQLTFANGHFINIMSGPFYSLVVEVQTPNASLSYMHDGAFLFAGWKSIALGIVGNDVFIGLNGVQIWTGSGTGLVWPQDDDTDQFRIGNNVAYTMDAGAQGIIEHFRIREGEGYAGGNYTAPQYPWYPGQKLGEGLATLEDTTCICDGIVLPVISGSGIADIQSITQVAEGGRPSSGEGLATLEDIAGYGDDHKVWVGQSVVTLDGLTPDSSGISHWIFYGKGLATADSITATGSGIVGAVVGISGICQANLANFSGSGNGMVSASGYGISVLDDATGSGIGFTVVCVGLASIEEITNTCAGIVSANGHGLSLLDDLSAHGDAQTSTFCSGLVSIDSMIGVGNGLNIISGIGVGFLGDIEKPYWIPDMSRAVYTKRQEHIAYV